MKKPRMLSARQILHALRVILLALVIVNAQAQSQAQKATEGEIGIELFGVLAEQSGCSAYVVAWGESATQQIRSQCFDELFEAQRFTLSVGRKTKFLVDVLRAKSAYHQPIGNVRLSKPTNVLVYLLVSHGGKSQHTRAAAPMLIYENESKRRYSADTGVGDPSASFSLRRMPK